LKKFSNTIYMCIFLVLFFILNPAIPSNADMSGEEESLLSERSENVKNLSMALFLIKYGRENKSPVALLTAAEIMGGIYVVCEDKDNPEDAFLQEIYDILEEAKIMSGMDPYIENLSNEIEEDVEENQKDPSIKGELLRTIKFEDEIESEKTDTFYLSYEKNDEACICISGYEKTVLNLYVYDEYGSLIAKDESPNCECEVSWVSQEQGEFKIELKNQGKVKSRYIFIHN